MSKEFKGVKVRWKVEYPDSNRPSRINVSACKGQVSIYDAPLTNQNIANAKLIAAAPDLLEPLQEMNEFCISLDVWASSENTVGLYKAVQNAEKAINKAIN